MRTYITLHPFEQLVASARRSGQEDFQRGTPPVSLASCSISPFLRACIITEWSSKDHETDSMGTSILIPLLLLNFNMRLHGNPTAWYLFLATDQNVDHRTRIAPGRHWTHRDETMKHPDRPGNTTRYSLNRDHRDAMVRRWSMLEPHTNRTTGWSVHFSLALYRNSCWHSL